MVVRSRARRIAESVAWLLAARSPRPLAPSATTTTIGEPAADALTAALAALPPEDATDILRLTW